jgi:PAS domain S-box-containing protein
MESEWIWDKLDPTEQHIAELLVQGKSNAAICAEVFLSRARVQECIKRIIIKAGARSTRGAIVSLVEERETQTLCRVLDQASDGVAIAQDRVVKFANRAFHEMHGYAPGEMAGMPMIEIIAPRSWDLVAKEHSLRLKGVAFPQSYDIRILCKNGEEKDASVARAGLIRYTGRPAVLAVVVPAVEDRETLALLSVLDEATDGVIILQDHVVKFANKALRDMFGYDLEEMVGVPFVEFGAPRSSDAQVKRYDQRMEGKPFPGSYAATALCKGGQEKDVVVASGGIVQYRGKPALLAIVVPAAKR